MDDNFTLEHFRTWDDIEPKPGGIMREVTKVRFFIGVHGPYERTFDRGVDPSQIETAITDQRNALRRLAAL